MKVPVHKRWSTSRRGLYLLAIPLLLPSVQAKAQTFFHHEFSIWNASGISTLIYNPSFGKRNTRTGSVFGTGYTFYFHREWGIHTGAEVALYNTTFHLKNLRNIYTCDGFDNLTPGWTGSDEKIDYHSEWSNYIEQQQLYGVNIPLKLQFQTSLAGGWSQFFASAGVKLGIPILSTYKVTEATVYTWYYDYKTNQEFRPDPTDYGDPYLEDLGCFYNYPYVTEKRASKFKVAGLATVEAGMRWWCAGLNRSLYVGAYLDYGFNDTRKHSGNRFVEFDSKNDEMSTNSIITSQYAHDGGAATNFINKVAPLSFGIKFRVGIKPIPKER